jgi:DNA (cytosine-5)-methyltransferase 1
MHVFFPTSLKVSVGDTVYDNNQKWTDSAPYRTITVRDIMSDLPAISNGDQKGIMKYEKDPESHYQKRMRKDTHDLTDHICKAMNPLVEKRMELIPIEEVRLMKIVSIGLSVLSKC